MFLGVYPALTEKKMLNVGGLRMWLPTQVEAQSFAVGSASGAELDDNYLVPLGLTRESVFITDLLPYFLANTSKSSSGRSMADNIAAYQDEARVETGIEARPSEAALVELAHDMPGNVERLRDYLTQCQPKLLFTLGTESAAFVRGISYDEASDQVDSLLYSGAEQLEILGVAPLVVHLVHPHLFIKQNKKWMGRHQKWCDEAGVDLLRTLPP